MLQHQHQTQQRQHPLPQRARQMHQLVPLLRRQRTIRLMTGILVRSLRYQVLIMMEMLLAPVLYFT
jgi:hypothetical protein